MEDFPLTQVMGTFPNQTLPPMTPHQPIPERPPIAPMKGIPTSITQRYREYEQELVETFNNFYFLLRRGYLMAKSPEDTKYFNGRIVEFRGGLDKLITINPSGGKRKKTKKRSRRS